MDREDFSEALLDAAPDDDLASLDRAVLNAGDRLPLDDFDALLALRNQDNLTKQLRDRIDRHLQKRFPDQLTALATTLLYDRQPQMSALSPLSSWQRATLLILPALGMVGIIFFPEITAKTALCILFLYCIASTTLFLAGHAFILNSTLIAVTRRFGIRRALWSPCLWLYWQLATIPAYRALWEMFGQQSTWKKTAHGLSKAAKQRRDKALKDD